MDLTENRFQLPFVVMDRPQSFLFCVFVISIDGNDTNFHSWKLIIQARVMGIIEPTYDDGKRERERGKRRIL